MSFSSELPPPQVVPLIIRFWVDEGKGKQDKKQGQSFACFSKTGH